MKLRLQHIVIGCILLGLFGFLTWYGINNTVAVLEPKGIIAEQQKDLLVFTVLLSMVIIIPVFAMATIIAYKYREGNTKARYMPKWDHDKKLEALWWGVPLLIIAVLSVITYRTSHSLDPYRPLESEKEPIKVQVIALEWKWLFLYPEQHIATVNYLQIPEDTPINFEITADAPMNSFWIPQLGGMVYAMNGMTSKLHLQADEQGTYRGVSSNISGEGFADMKFDTNVTSRADFDSWVAGVAKEGMVLTFDHYKGLAEPTIKHPVVNYASYQHNLYDTIINKYMQPHKTPDETFVPHDASHAKDGY